MKNLGTICIASSNKLKHAFDGFEGNLSTMCGHNCWYILLFWSSCISSKTKKILRFQLYRKNFNNIKIISSINRATFQIIKKTASNIFNHIFMNLFVTYRIFIDLFIIPWRDKDLITSCKECKEDRENGHFQFP